MAKPLTLSERMEVGDYSDDARDYVSEVRALEEERNELDKEVRELRKDRDQFEQSLIELLNKVCIDKHDKEFPTVMRLGGLVQHFNLLVNLVEQNEREIEELKVGRS